MADVLEDHGSWVERALRSERKVAQTRVELLAVLGWIERISEHRAGCCQAGSGVCTCGREAAADALRRLVLEGSA